MALEPGRQSDPAHLQQQSTGQSFLQPPSARNNGFSWPNLPDYIKPLPVSLDSDDIEYLQKKGAFTLPDRPLMEECLRCYALYIHPLYPTVNVIEIQSILNDDKDGEAISLLLLQSLIFAGSMWADVRLVRNAGFLTRKAFRQSWHQKIRLLYDMDYEEDRHCLVQSLLLWSFWWRSINERKDSWHWIGIAYSIARTVDLHQASLGGINASLAQRKHQRRLWWALYTREIIGSLGMMRAPRIKPGDYNVAMLCTEDFDSDEGTTEVLTGLSLPSKEQHQALTRLTIDFTKLIYIFGRILTTACPENAAGRTAVLYSAQQMEGSNQVLSKRQLNIEELKNCQQQLMTWRQELGRDLWRAENLPFDPPAWSRSELCHRGLLAMLYHLALMTIHRPQMLSTEESVTSSRAIVRSCAQEITKIAMDFFRADLIKCLSATAVSCLMPASIHHVFDTFSEDIKVRSEATRQLEECRVMLHTLSEQQFASAWILQTIQHIIDRIKVPSRTEKVSWHPRVTDSRGVASSSYDECITPRSRGEVCPEGSATDEDQTHNFPEFSTVTEDPAVRSLPDVRTANDCPESRTVLDACNSREDWAASFWNAPDAGPMAQLPLPSDALVPLQPDLANTEALADMWMDFAFVPDNMSGLPGL
ncbi:hypothetical protein PV08_05207 [Exophiala spinifera]|uniref:Xylanolytic transcriptional activator regulatory domain-containing protein n=1 Tax=Exophiala spinifera TaxID=91928 RepID=A0A0D1ZQT6_9EURO|nr:uncharacterized protein PV08_05207 [Exophiala spinifera]KIW15162.1 hypothetical protein PV08_05207 [Exophiala spinifera]